MSKFDDLITGLLEGSGEEGNKVLSEMQNVFKDVGAQTQAKLVKEAEKIKGIILKKQSGKYDDDDVDTQFKASKAVLQGLAADAMVKAQLQLKQAADNVAKILIEKLFQLIISVATGGR